MRNYKAVHLKSVMLSTRVTPEIKKKERKRTRWPEGRGGDPGRVSGPFWGARTAPLGSPRFVEGSGTGNQVGTRAPRVEGQLRPKDLEMLRGESSCGWRDAAAAKVWRLRNGCPLLG